MNPAFFESAQALAHRCAASLHRHPQRFAAAVATLFLFGGGAALAVASLAPDAAQLPVQQVLHAVEPLPLQAQIDALQSQRYTLSRHEISRSTDTAQSLFKRLGIDDAAAAAFLSIDPQSRQHLLGRAGRLVKAEVYNDHSLAKLSARWSPEDNGQFKRWVLERTPQGLQSRLESAPLKANQRLASGTIRTSLFAATDEAAIPDAVATQLADIFSGDIDFHRALRKGDRFSVVYETLEADGEPVRSGKVLSAEFVNNGRALQALWFQEPGVHPLTGTAHKGGYYTLDGASLRRAYLASPMEFSRISSGFKMRFHPILQAWRAHLGVDYAAPSGTPVRSVADGVVEFAGWQNGFGNVVFVKHRNNHSTVYAHLSKILLRKGQGVSQGQHVGLVGATGWATGPHLHFEFRVNGAHQDPLAIARQSEAVPVSPAARPLFNQAVLAMRPQLEAAASLQLATAQ
ncbi:MAG: peptidoglycan DD-metalloendopeptidase family protein [Burkholderiaceae bacterium]